MRDLLYLGSTPGDEPCAQVGNPDYEEMARAECKRYITQLRAMFGKEPEGAKLQVKGEAHDYGRYFEVVCYYDTDIPESMDYAFKVENNLPGNWK